jgi:hypothetical protein
MYFFVRPVVLMFIISQISQLIEGSIGQTNFHINKRKYLANHVIETRQAETEFECGLHCVQHGSCVSVNYKTAGIGKGLCELNNITMQEVAGNADKSVNVVRDPDFNHLYMIKLVRTKKNTPGIV